MLQKERLFISFSGGLTSAYMTWLILNQCGHTYKEIIVLFANTGQERAETLDFVNACDNELDFKTVWLESVTHQNLRKGNTHKIVNFETADRVGFVFEEMIKKYGIPNIKYPHCTRELKINPMYDYIKTIGWERGSYDIAIGIRADEMDRVAVNYKDKNIVYPLIAMNITKTDVQNWWAKQSFALNLANYEGNCSWCWKKSYKKHFRLVSEKPDIYQFPRRMEDKYGYSKGYKRVFFRGNLSTRDILSGHFNNDDMFGSGCGETCEVFADEVIS
ncbi:MAG: hypothetical protein COA43_00520 [Robiginitomaculum sp.]|nr:MAG: hypothetical protein COA43_00520 [Robiginitomaculum sp.]